jgi:hypothetical protein
VKKGEKLPLEGRRQGIRARKRNEHAWPSKGVAARLSS